jgi:hypothetical protein
MNKTREYTLPPCPAIPLTEKRGLLGPCFLTLGRKDGGDIILFFEN